jgi:hypothetical protein
MRHFFRVFGSTPGHLVLRKPAAPATYAAAAVVALIPPGIAAPISSRHVPVGADDADPGRGDRE